MKKALTRSDNTREGMASGLSGGNPLALMVSTVRSTQKSRNVDAWMGEGGRQGKEKGGKVSRCGVEKMEIEEMTFGGTD